MKKMKSYDVKFTLLTDSADSVTSVKRLIEILEEEVKLQGINYSIKNVKVRAKRNKKRGIKVKKK